MLRRHILPPRAADYAAVIDCRFQSAMPLRHYAMMLPIFAVASRHCHALIFCFRCHAGLDTPCADAMRICRRFRLLPLPCFAVLMLLLYYQIAADTAAMPLRYDASVMPCELRQFAITASHADIDAYGAADAAAHMIAPLLFTLLRLDMRMPMLRIRRFVNMAIRFIH